MPFSSRRPLVWAPAHGYASLVGGARGAVVHQAKLAPIPGCQAAYPRAGRRSAALPPRQPDLAESPQPSQRVGQSIARAQHQPGHRIAITQRIKMASPGAQDLEPLAQRAPGRRHCRERRRRGGREGGFPAPCARGERREELAEDVHAAGTEAVGGEVVGGDPALGDEIAGMGRRGELLDDSRSVRWRRRDRSRVRPPHCRRRHARGR